MFITKGTVMVTRSAAEVGTAALLSVVQDVYETCLESPGAGIWGFNTVMHNMHVLTFWNFGEKERSRRRRSWAERWEGDRKARLRVL
jgi:hypothetical protein